MHNLRNTEHARFQFDNHAVTATAWDVTDDSLILAFGPTEHDAGITLKRLASDAKNASDAKTIASWDAPSPNPDLPVDAILDLHHFADTNSISLILAGGDIVLVREDPQDGEDLIEIVGSVDAGISAATWSPDEDLVAIITRAETLLLMTRTFDSAANVTLSPEDVQISNHVSVGWGKKETQFKGRGVAKTLRDPTVPEHVDAGALSPLDDGRVHVSWRGDGQYLAISSILDVEQQRRIIRVYARDGTLESVSEPIDGLEGAISWKPTGQTIAGVQRRDGAIRVVLFERNGLRHGEFELRLDNEEQESFGGSIHLRWNVDSTILAVSMKDRVQLWTVNNYHYYLKQEVRFERCSTLAARISWHPEKARRLTCSSGDSVRRLSYDLEVCRGSIEPPHDIGLVAVIDGKTLKVTPLRIANIPPPMAFDEIELADNALDVAIDDSNCQIAVLHHNAVSLWRIDYDRKPIQKAVLKETIPVHRESNHLRSQSPWKKIDSVHSLYMRTDHDRIIYGDPELPAPPTRAGLAQLSANGTLSVSRHDQSLRIGGCTSYLVTTTHLIYTTSLHLLKFIHLSDGKLEVPADEPEKDERCRSIERGAKIITVMPSAYSLVLQMPRGNLETIYPRALVLAGIRQSLKNRDYAKAFLTCRTQRVDMNILHDYLPEQFMRDIGLFIKQVKKTEFIDLFLSSLSEDDVSQTMYRETLDIAEKNIPNGVLKGDTKNDKDAQDSKVNRICDSFLSELRSRPSSRLQNIVTAHVCKNPPDLRAGLELVSNLRSNGDDEKLEEAVEHICFLADVNQLYDTALGIYDLDVALLIAQQAQKDPREYLPYLESLHEMQPLRMRFTIDKDLKKYDKAIVHLHAMDAYDELKTHMQEHELYSTAIQLYRYDSVRFHELTALYADFLTSRNRFKEAGIAYEFVSDHASAYTAFRNANMWQECLSNASLLPLSSHDLLALAEDLAGGLEESKDYKSAATIALEYLNDLERAARLSCRGYLFADAMRVVTLRNRPDLLLSIIDPGLVEASATITEISSEMKAQIGAQVPRLRELRQRKEDDPMAFLDGAEGGDGDVPDNISLAPTDASTTGGTFMTRYTNRSDGTLATNATRKTSKNRRREERKRARGKKGTVYEEEYLENSIARLIERLNEVGGDVGRVVECLMRRGMRERAIAVQTVFEEVVNLCEGCKDEVFSPSSTTHGDKIEQTTNDDEEVRRPWGGQGVLWEALKTKKREAPVLRQLERLDLVPIDR